MPVEVHKALIIEFNGEFNHKPLRHLIATNYMGNGLNVVKMKPPYTNKPKAGIIKYFMQLDKVENLSSDKDGMITLNEVTQRDLMNSMFSSL